MRVGDYLAGTGLGPNIPQHPGTLHRELDEAEEADRHYDTSENFDENLEGLLKPAYGFGISTYVPPIRQSSMAGFGLLGHMYGGGRMPSITGYAGGGMAGSQSYGASGPSASAPSELYVGRGNWTSLTQRLQPYQKQHPFFGQEMRTISYKKQDAYSVN